MQAGGRAVVGAVLLLTCWRKSQHYQSRRREVTETAIGAGTGLLCCGEKEERRSDRRGVPDYARWPSGLAQQWDHLRRGKNADARSLWRSRGSTARERGLEVREEGLGGEGSLTQAQRCPRHATDVGPGRPKQVRAEEAPEATQEARRGSDKMLDVRRRLGADPEGRSYRDTAERDFWRRAVV